MATLRAIAVDLGAGSCRISLAEWNGEAPAVRLVHRFPNGPVTRGDHLYWDLHRLESGIEEGLRLCPPLISGGDRSVHSVGITGWGVDYVRLGADAKPLDDPFCYRDPRTDSAMPEVLQRISRERLYELTGIQFMRLNTLFQLYADARDGLDSATRWVNVPEYFLGQLAGGGLERFVAEYTNATTTQLVRVHERDWADEIFHRVGLNRQAAPRIVPSGTPLGSMRGELAKLPSYRATQVTAPACHDTAAAVAGIPDTGRDWAFISSGTWSLVGTVLDSPCTTRAAQEGNFTNEGGIGGTIRFLKNVNGLWILEECLRAWEAADGRRWHLPDLLSACEGLPASSAIFDVDAPDLLLPGRMPAKINRALELAGRAPIPEDLAHAPEMATAIFASLAARYAQVVRTMEEVLRRRFWRIYVVGGGSQNAVLNRLLAEATGLEVDRGSVESATVGNLAVQFASLENEGSVNAASVSAWAERLSCAVTADTLRTT